MCIRDSSRTTIKRDKQQVSLGEQSTYDDPDHELSRSLHDSEVPSAVKKFGNFETDEPLSIENHEYGRNLRGRYVDKDNLFFKVIWKARKDNYVPNPSYFSLEEVKQKAQSLLLDYYIQNAELVDKGKFQI
eukprot:TRINITY_DN11512_c0_g1_i1.p2 TRINITY_DN11512_c0_g1~~TRINITY_DN11512_c0_g1_i1.p2  ORF type:complete len:131 (+),score=2.54 TRINITY_DN11512_c0_g1_i1:78-470(+)